MDDLLGKIASQTVTFAIRSGIGVASSFAIGQCSRYIRSVKGSDKGELLSLQSRLETKIKIISPAIDLVEIIAARGNTSLESAVLLTKALRRDIQSLGVRLQDAAATEERERMGRKKGHDPDEAKRIILEMKGMMSRIEDAVPLISLAVTASGVTLSTTMPQSVSPSRLLQASTLLTTGDAIYNQSPFSPSQIGTTFTLTMYQLFAGHSHRTVEDLTWQEVASKCRVKLLRVPLSYGGDVGEELSQDEQQQQDSNYMRGREKADEYAYELRVVEDLDDGRVHEEEGEEVDDIKNAGRRLSIPIHQIAKIFYTNSGKLLGIDAASPVLLIKRDDQASPPRRLLERIGRYEMSDDEDEEDNDDSYVDGPSAQLTSFISEQDASFAEEAKKKWAFPSHLDKEWLAFEVWTEPVDDDEDDDEESISMSSSQQPTSPAQPASVSSLIPGFTKLLRTSRQTTPTSQALVPSQQSQTHPPSSPPVLDSSPSKHDADNDNVQLSSINVKSSLSLLECLLRLTGLQNYQQASHLSVHDELLNLFLSDSYGDEKGRRRERVDARRKIGFDPFGTPANPRRTVGFDESQTGYDDEGQDDVYDDDDDGDDDNRDNDHEFDPASQSTSGNNHAGRLVNRYDWSSPQQTHSARFKNQNYAGSRSGGSSPAVSGGGGGGPLFMSTPLRARKEGSAGGRRSTSGSGIRSASGGGSGFNGKTKSTSQYMSSPLQAKGRESVIPTPSKLGGDDGGV